MPYIDLRRLQMGTEEVTLSNAHQESPLTLVVTLRRTSREVSASFSYRHSDATVAAMLQSASLLACLEEGCQLTITFLAAPSLAGLVATASPHPGVGPTPELEELLGSLSAIEEFGHVRFDMSQDFTVGEAQRARFLAEVLRNRTYAVQRACVVALTEGALPTLAALATFPARLSFVVEHEEEELVELHGVTVNLGHYRTVVEAEIEKTVIDEAIATRDPDGAIRLRIPLATARTEYGISTS